MIIAHVILVPFGGRQRSNTDSSLRSTQPGSPVVGQSTPRPHSSALPSSHSFSDRSGFFSGIIRRPSFASELLADHSNKENYIGADLSPLTYAQSPPNMEGPVVFAVPDLTEETLLGVEHRNTVNKLQFVSSLVVSLVELAQSRTSPLLDSPNHNKLSGCMVFVSEKQRRMEQLVLYIRALHVLTSSLQLAKQEVAADRLQPTPTVKTGESLTNVSV